MIYEKLIWLFYEMEKHNNSLECMKNCYAIFFFDKLKRILCFEREDPLIIFYK